MQKNGWRTLNDMKLYHGSYLNIGKISLAKCKRYKDFGKAFYLSEDKSQAEEMANNVAAFIGGTPTLNVFECDDNIFNDKESNPLKIKIFEHYCLEWAEFVWNNRDDNQDFSHPYDIVYGPIANDNIGLQMRMYRMSGKTLEEFLNGLVYRKGETFQYAFCTERAIKFLKKQS